MSAAKGVEIRRAVWSGAVPVELTLAANEVTASGANPPPLYMLMARTSLLPVEFETIRGHFLQFAPAREDSMWLQDAETGEPLKWQWPIGVLFDLYRPAVLPWRVVVHFQSFPAKTLLRHSGEIVRAHFVNSFKQACFLFFGSTKPALSLNKHQHESLWDAVQANRLSSFTPVLEQVHRAHGERKPFHHAPVRVIVRGFGTDYDNRIVQVPISCGDRGSESSATKEASSTSSSSSSSSSTTSSSSSSSSSSSVNVVTLLDVLVRYLNVDREALQRSLPANGSHANSAAAASATAAAFDEGGSCSVALVHGVPVPLETPVLWLCRYMSHADMFVYVTVVNRKHRSTESSS